MTADYTLFVTQFLVHSSQPGQTGGTLSNCFLLQTLARFRTVKVLAFDASAATIAAFAADGILVHTVTPPQWRGLHLVAHWAPFVERETLAFARRHGAPRDILVTTSTLPAIALAPHLPTTRWIAIVQAYENFGLRPPSVPWRTRLALAKSAVVRRFRDATHLRRADAVVTNSGFMHSAIVARFGLDAARVFVVPQWCDIQPSVIPFRDAGRTVGFVHRGPDKNLPFVLTLARRLPDMQFLVYGHTARVPARLPRNVSVMGFVVDRAAMFGSAAVWLMPSAWPEPLGRVSIEAQAANRPVLVADAGGLPETVADSQYLATGFDPAAWTMAIHRLSQLPPPVIERNGSIIRMRFSKAAHDACLARALQ